MKSAIICFSTRSGEPALFISMNGDLSSVTGFLKAASECSVPYTTDRQTLFELGKCIARFYLIPGEFHFSVHCIGHGTMPSLNERDVYRIDRTFQLRDYQPCELFEVIDPQRVATVIHRIKEAEALERAIESKSCPHVLVSLLSSFLYYHEQGLTPSSEISQEFSDFVARVRTTEASARVAYRLPA